MKRKERTKTDEAVHMALAEVSAPYWKKLRKEVWDAEAASRIGKNLLRVIHNDVRTGTKIVTKAIKKDKDLREAYQANIAMAFKDAAGQYKNKTGKSALSRADIHVIANQAANYFLQLWCDEIKYPTGR